MKRSALLAAAAVAQALRVPNAAELGPRPEVLRLRAGSAVTVSSAALLMSGMSGGALGVAAQAVTVPRAGGGRLTLVILEVDLSSLPEAVAAPRVEAAVYALSTSGNVAATTATELELDASPQPAGLQIVAGLALAPGRYRLRILAREHVSGAIGLNTLELEVAETQAGPAAWLLQPGGSWVLGLTDAAAEVLQTESSVVVVRPVLRPGDRATARLLWPEGAAPPPRIEALIALPDERSAWTGELTVEPQDGPAGPGGAYRVSVLIPDLPPGAYTLIFASPGDRVAGRSAAVPFEVPTGPVSGSPDVGLAREVLPGSTRLAAAAYEDLLRDVAAGEVGAGRQRLRSLEQSARRSSGGRDLPRLIRGEQAVMGRIAREAPAALIALLGLHTPLLEHYHEAGAAVLEGYAVTTVERLTRSLSRRSEALTDRARAARALSAAGATLQRTGWHDASARAFGAAIALDRGNREALLGAAASREKAEDYQGAVELLDLLVAAAPESEEGRLRLALNLVRIGKSERAKEILRDLSAEAAQRWISVLAFQELARSERGRGAERAEEVLRQGLARWPGQPGLLLQLAQLRGNEQPAAATAELLQPLLRGLSTGTSPRYDYNRWPRPESEEPGGSEGQEELARWLARAGP